MQESPSATRASRKGAVTRPAAGAVARVATAFAELDEGHRIVLCLHYLERLSLPQIAAVLDDSEENVQRAYAEAVRRLGRGGRPARRRRTAA